MRKLFILLAALVAISLNTITVSAKEQQFILRGTVTMGDTTAWVPLDQVHVSLTSATTGEDVPFKLLTGNDTTKIINDNGEMRLLVKGGQGKYMLTLDREGYDPLLRDVELKFKNQNVLWVGSMQMRKEKTIDLKEVEVVGTAIKLVVKGDTMVYNANAFNLAEGSMLDALIKQLDGVQLDSDGQITVNGRKVNSLLINGKDFFKGDPQVALENLPAYTVNNVKVYDKAADDDYLSQASSKLARREDEENLVMDVVLKKEYNIGYTASVEAGYGSDNRWLGKGFGLGFSDKWRLSAYVNANNVNDNERAGSNGNWNGGSGGSGETTRESGGLDYMFDNDKLRINGNVSYTRSDATSRSETASQHYYPSGDIFTRSAGWNNNIVNSLRTSHELKQKWDAVYFGADWNLSWNKNDFKSLTRQATFNAMPDETTRVEALDDVFALPGTRRYYDILLSRLGTAVVNNPGNFSTSGELEATIRTANMQGRVNTEVSGGYSSSWNEDRTLYLQHFGGANTSTAAPTNSDRFADSDSRNWNVNANANYSRDWSSIVGEKWQNRISLRSRLAYSHNYSHSDYDLFMADGDLDPDAPLTLPSLMRTENMLQNLKDSYLSTRHNNNGDARLTLNFNREAIAPSPTGINPSWGLNASVTYALRNEQLDYHVLSFDPENLSRTKHHVTETVGANFSSNNDYRYWRFGLTYSNSISDPSLNLFLRNRSNSNPMHIYENNAGELKSAFTNTLRFNMFRTGRKVHNTFSGDFTWSKTDNSVGQWSYYNRETGVTTYKPMNINGNWNTRGNLYYSHPLGKREQFIISGSANATYNHSVDFQSTENAVPERSLVKNTNLAGSLRLTYKFTNGSNITIHGGPSWQYATSAREKFNKVDAMTYNAGLDGVAELPWNMQLRTDLNFQARRGYAEASMNTTTWLWNASLTKSIMRGNMIFKVAAVDILNQIDPVHYYVNAQGQTETWTNTLPRYVMFSVTYRFNRGPQKGGNQQQGGGMRPDGGSRGPRGGGMGGGMHRIRM